MATLEITTKIGCRNNCRYCPQDRLIEAFSRRRDRTYLERAKTESVFQMSFEIFARCIASVPVDVDIHFTGMCEPWLNPACSRMLRHAHEKGHRIAVSTTLAGMTSEDVDAIADVPFKMFWVHLPSADGSEAIRVDADYIGLLKRIMASPIVARFHFHGAALHPGLGGVPVPAQKLMLSTRSANARVDNGLLIGGRNPGVITCARGLRCNVLLPSGEVVLCCNDYGMQHVLGNLMQDDYAALHRSAAFERVARGLSDPREEILCRYCDVDVVENRARIAGRPGGGH